MATMFVFIILRIVPGDPALAILLSEAQDGDVTYTDQDLADLRAELGTDRAIHIQYGIWFWNMLQLDFGVSFWDQKPIGDRVIKKFPITLELTVLAVLLATVVAVPLGVISAIKQDTWGDYAGRIISIAGIALPNFWVAIMIIFFLVMWFNWIPPLGYVDLWKDPWANMQQLFFPAVALGFSNLAFISRVTRSAMLEVLREDYIRTARSKGLREGVVISRHALKNALLPVVTVSGYEFGRLIAGTVIIETIFMVPGMGRLLVNSIFHRDFTMVQAIIVVITVIVLGLNVIMDLLYAWLNPRIRYS